MFTYLNDVQKARIDAKDKKIQLSEIIDNRYKIFEEVIFKLP